MENLISINCKSLISWNFIDNNARSDGVQSEAVAVMAPFEEKARGYSGEAADDKDICTYFLEKVWNNT